MCLLHISDTREKKWSFLNPWRGRLSLSYHCSCVFQLLKSNSIFEIANSACTACVCFQQHMPVIALSLFVLYLHWSNLQFDYNDFIWRDLSSLSVHYANWVYTMQTADANWSVSCKRSPPTLQMTFHSYLLGWIHKHQLQTAAVMHVAAHQSTVRQTCFVKSPKGERQKYFYPGLA